MRQINIPVHIDRLKALGARFEDFRTELTTATPLTGTDGLAQLTRHIRISHELTLEALTRLTAINGSQATQMTGALTALDCLAQTVQHAGLVSESLTAAVAVNTYDAASWDPPADTDTIGHGLRHLDSRKAIAAHLGDASASLAICAQGCQIVADHLADEFSAWAKLQTGQARTPAVASPAPSSAFGTARTR
ncbi:hypothetical protein ACWC98_21710 [Streptomyces goshikiensis]